METIVVAQSADSATRARSDFRQQIAESWPGSIDDRYARHDWGWQAQYDMNMMVSDMLKNLSKSAVLSKV